MPLHSLELLLDPASEAEVRRDWDALAAAGLPSQAHHRGPTNAPHVTIASAPAIDEAAEIDAVEAFEALLPRAMDLSGVVLLGRGPYALARLLAPDAALREAAHRVRRRLDDPHSGGWLAHVTLARRLPTGLVGDAIAAVATGPDAPRTVVVTALRRWNPDTGTTATLTEPATP